jgi:hypothetical protein
MIDWNQEINNLNLSRNERIVLIILAKSHISQNKNISHEKLKKRIEPGIRGNLDEIIDSLNKKKLLRIYRKENYSLNQKGLIISHILEEREYERKYRGLRRI